MSIIPVRDDSFTLPAAVYPRTYDPAYATSCALLAIIFASAFALIFPLLAPAILVLLFLTLVGELPLLRPSVFKYSGVLMSIGQQPIDSLLVTFTAGHIHQLAVYFRYGFSTDLQPSLHSSPSSWDSSSSRGAFGLKEASLWEQLSWSSSLRRLSATGGHVSPDVPRCLLLRKTR